MMVSAYSFNTLGKLGENHLNPVLEDQLGQLSESSIPKL